MPEEPDLKVDRAGQMLGDPKLPMKQRFRALFALRNFGGEESIKAISASFSDPSALLKHELAYCLGQMGDERALPVLKEVLMDENQQPMVRHEAGEALGAIGSKDALEILETCEKTCHAQEVQETCALARERIKWLDLKENLNEKGDGSTTIFSSIDPAPPLQNGMMEIGALKETLTNLKNPLWLRYRAMFSLRNLNTNESAAAIGEGLRCMDSALFRHEIAYVLGQLQKPVVVEALEERLADSSENCMVRHECAEALGSIATEKCHNILKKFLTDPDPVVSESCEVALDMCDYENSLDVEFFK